MAVRACVKLKVTYTLRKTHDPCIYELANVMLKSVTFTV